MVDFQVKEKVRFKDLQPLLDEFLAYQKSQVTLIPLLKAYISSTTTLTREQIDELTVEELTEVLKAVTEKYPPERLLAPFLVLQGQQV